MEPPRFSLHMDRWFSPAHGPLVTQDFTPFAPDWEKTCCQPWQKYPITSVFPKQQVSLSHSEKSCGQQNYLSRRQVHSDIVSGFPCPSSAPLKHEAYCLQSLGKALPVVELVWTWRGKDI